VEAATVRFKYEQKPDHLHELLSRGFEKLNEISKTWRTNEDKLVFRTRYEEKKKERGTSE
jgi:hypothetical protein